VRQCIIPMPHGAGGFKREFSGSQKKRSTLSPFMLSTRAEHTINEIWMTFRNSTQVLLFQKSEQTDWFFHRWGQIYREDRLKIINWLFPRGSTWYRHAIPNQPLFRRTLYESGLRIATLPPEYNSRFPFPGFLHTKVKILHGHVHSFARISEELNETLLPRVHVMRWGKLKTLESAMPPGEDILARTRWSLHHRGILQTAWATMEQCMWKLWKIFT
jgi:hypothetical protein